MPTRANGSPAFAYYVAEAGEELARPNGLVVLRLDGDQIGEIIRFGIAGLVGAFDLPETLRLS